MIITLDGPAGSGKSTVAKILAEKLNFYQIDSGALYRTVTYYVLQEIEKQKIDIISFLENPLFKTQLNSLDLVVTFENYKQYIFLDNKNVETYIREPIITQNIKYIADNFEIRQYVNEKIRFYGSQYNIIADGRDMGTVVFPNADLKFFLTASLEERAKRRLAEFQQKNQNFSMTVEEVMKDIELRDQQDSNRVFGKLECANNAILVDTGSKKVVQVISEIFTYISKSIN